MQLFVGGYAQRFVQDVWCNMELRCKTTYAHTYKYTAYIDGHISVHLLMRSIHAYTYMYISYVYV